MMYSLSFCAVTMRSLSFLHGTCHVARHVPRCTACARCVSGSQGLITRIVSIHLWCLDSIHLWCLDSIHLWCLDSRGTCVVRRVGRRGGLRGVRTQQRPRLLPLTARLASNSLPQAKGRTRGKRAVALRGPANRSLHQLVSHARSVLRQWRKRAAVGPARA